MEEMNDMTQVEETAARSMPKQKKKLYGEHYLAIAAGVLAVITLVLTLFSLPYILAEPLEEDPEQIMTTSPSPAPTASNATRTFPFSSNVSFTIVKSSLIEDFAEL